MNNITDYSDNELSLMVFNDEGLYSIRHSFDLFTVLKENFIYTEEQMEVLINDLNEDER